MAGSVWNGHVSTSGREPYSCDSLWASQKSSECVHRRTNTLCGVCLCSHACYSKAERAVDSFMCTVWSGLSCNQAHTADNSMITHSHSCIHTHTLNINCSKELQNYKEVTLPRWFFKSVLYGGISFVLFCNSGRFLQADILCASFVMLIWENTVLFWHYSLIDWTNAFVFGVDMYENNIPDMHADYLLWPYWIHFHFS